MGAFASNEAHANKSQYGAGYTNNFDELQKNIQRLVKNNNFNAATETINFTNEDQSSIDIDSIKDLRQNGGGLDRLAVLPTRSRFNAINVSQTGGKLLQLSSIDENDFNILKDVLKRHDNSQTGGCGCSQPVITSDTSPIQNPVKYNSMMGGALSATSPDSVNYDILTGGKVLLSPTSPDQVNYNFLYGGSKDEKNKKKKDDSSDDSSDSDDVDSDDVDSDDVDSDDVDSDEDEDEDEDEDYDESADGDELSRTKGSTSSSSSSESDKKKKKHKKMKRHTNKNYLQTSESGSSEVVLNTKYLYSDNNSFYGSDDNSEYYGSFRNRSMMH